MRYGLLVGRETGHMRLGHGKVRLSGNDIDIMILPIASPNRRVGVDMGENIMMLCLLEEVGKCAYSG
jgi:hypothetical protein